MHGWTDSGAADVLVIGASEVALSQVVRMRSRGFRASLLDEEVLSAVFDEPTGNWDVVAACGTRFRARFVVAACEPVSLGVHGRRGRTLADHWSDGPRSYLGVMAAGFPNFFFPGGHRPGPACDAEQQVELVADALEQARARDREVVDVDPAAESTWSALVRYDDSLALLAGGGCPDVESVPGPIVGRAADLIRMVAASVTDPFAAFTFSKAGCAA